MSYYDTLFIHKKASQEEIKLQYQRLALDAHPDRKGGNLEIFLDMKHAYEVLGDVKVRNFYDNFGQKGLGFCTCPVTKAIFSTIFTLWSLKILLMFVFTSTIAFLLFPILLWCCKNGMLEMYTFCMSLHAISCFIGIIYFIKCYLILRRNEDMEVKDFILFLFMIVVKMVLIILQITFGFMIVDKIITKYNIVYFIPYMVYETIIIIEEIKTIDYDEDINMKIFYCDILIKLNLRMMIIVLMCMSFELRYKFLFAMLIIIMETLYRFKNKGNFIAVISMTSIYFTCCFLASSNYVIPMIISISLVYIIVIVMIKKLYLNWLNVIPKSKYIKQKMIEN